MAKNQAYDVLYQKMNNATRGVRVATNIETDYGTPFLEMGDPDWTPNDSKYTRTILFHCVHCSYTTEFIPLAKKLLKMGADPEYKCTLKGQGRKSHTHNDAVNFIAHIEHVFKRLA